MQISRLFEMLYILLNCERITAAELARRLEVSVRTVYRDAQALCEAGVPLCAERGRDGGLYILSTFKLNKSVLSQEERRAILASLNAMHKTGASDEQVLRKLCAFLGSPAPDWVRIDFADWSGRRGALLSTLKSAILERNLLEFDYYGESCALTHRRVCPLRLWFKGSAWYLVAYCTTRQALRTFKLTRIKHAARIPGIFPPDADACTPDSLTDAPSMSSVLYAFTLRIAPCMAYRALDDFDAEDLTPLEDGGYIAHAAFPPGPYILSLILSYGEHAQVLVPESLRAQIAAKLAAMGALYAPRTP